MAKEPVWERQYLFIKNYILKKDRIYIEVNIQRNNENQYFRVEENCDSSFRGSLSVENDNHTYPDYISAHQR